MPSALVFDYAWVLLVVGALGVLLGIDRTLRHKKNESRLLRLLGFLGGLVMLALPSVVVLRGTDADRIAPVSLLIMLVLGLCLLARIMKAVPITFLVVGAVGIGLLIVALQIQDTELGGQLPMTAVAVVLLLVLGGVFAASFLVEAALDTFLALLGWGPVVAVVGAAAAVHGLLIAAGITGPAGLMEVL
jgi:hypothetical protein